MENVLAASLHDRFLTQTLLIANQTPFGCGVAFRNLLGWVLFVVKFEAFRNQTRQTLRFARKSTAGMATRVHFGTTLAHEFLTFGLLAHVLKGRKRRRRLAIIFFLTKPAAPCILTVNCFLAGHSCVVGVSIALATEVFGASEAANSELRKMFRCLFAQNLSSFILLVVVN